MKMSRKMTAKESEDPEHLLYTAIAAIKNASEARRFFEDLCTPTEIQAMADRWRVVAYIKAGISYRDIHEQTGVSITTIGRVARFISLGADGYNLIFERLRKTHENANKNKISYTKKRASKQ